MEARILAWSVAVVFVALGIAPVADRFTWLLENLPVIVGLPVLVAMHRRGSSGEGRTPQRQETGVIRPAAEAPSPSPGKEPLTPLLYRLLAVHAVILMVGGHWTYAEVPAGDWVRDWLGLARNPYDRLGHLAQGFVPAILIRELCLRRGVAVRGWFGALLIVLACLGFSALYEIIEWQTAVWTGEAAEAFLGTQGDIWDTQWDMACCGLGALAALALLARAHDRQLAERA